MSYMIICLLTLLVCAVLWNICRKKKIKICKRVLIFAIVIFSSVVVIGAVKKTETIRNRSGFACSKEAVGKKVLPYLWCSLGMCRGTSEHIVEKGRFSARFIHYWQQEPTVTKLSSWDVRYRFMNKNTAANKQWVSVEVLTPPKEVSTKGSIGPWVEMPFYIQGQPCLDIPDKQKFTTLSFKKIREEDQIFIKKHQLKQMASYIGTIKIENTVCCVYIVSMQKGRNSWKMEVVFPAVYRKNESKPGEISSAPIVRNDNDWIKVPLHPLNASIAGMFIGHFKILE